MITPLQIQLEDLPRFEGSLLHSASGSYHAMATSVRLLDAHTVVCCSRGARKICLIRFDLGFDQYAVVDSEGLDSGSMESSLCDIDGCGHVITSNGVDGNIRLYNVTRDKIRHGRDLGAVLPGNVWASLKFCGSDVIVVVACGQLRGIHFLDAPTMRTLLYVETERPPLDVCFLPGHRAVVVMTGMAAGADAEILLIKYDLGQQTYVVIDRQPCAALKLASVAFYDGRLYVVDTRGGCVLVLDVRTLRQVDQLDGYDVPHGVDARYGILAVACYGTGSIHVRPIRNAR